MNQGPIWGRLLKKTRGRQSRATVPLRQEGLYIAGLELAWPSVKAFEVVIMCLQDQSTSSQSFG